MITNSNPYRVGLTADGADADGFTTFGDIGLQRLTDAGLEWCVLPSMHDPVPAALADIDAVLSFGHMPFDGAAARACPRLKHVARFGAGYDGIDTAALAAEGVVVTNAPDAVRTPVAMSALTLLLALAHRLPENDDAARRNAWDERGRHRGIGVAGRTVGIVGTGGIGRELARLLAPLQVRLLGTNRHGATAQTDALGIEIVDLPTLARESDFVVIALALTPETHGLIGPDVLATMKPTAYLINVGRGAVVDQAALTRALQDGTIAGAGLDVFDPEPPRDDDPLLALPNVVLSPHCLSWTEDFTAAVSASVMESIIETARGERVANAIDPAVYDRPWRAAQRSGD